MARHPTSRPPRGPASSGNEYPVTPRGWTVVGRRRAWGFTTAVTYRDAAGRMVQWSSRRHRKRVSHRLASPGQGEHLLWSPHRLSWWIAVLFIVGSACFVIAPLSPYLNLVGPTADGVTFFVGSVFFTAAATLQWLETINAGRGPRAPTSTRRRLVRWEPGRIDWWSSGVQLAGTLFFNATTFRALTTATTSPSYDRVVWRPDALGSLCFLASGYLAYLEVAGRPLARPPGTVEGAIVSVNLFGCVAFGASAVAGFVIPSTSSDLDLQVANATTSLGAVAFLVGAALLLREPVTGTQPQQQPG